MSNERYPIAARLIGVMRKNESKMFMIAVVWSDHSEIIVYRSFQEFKKLHKRLKKQFPLENPFRRSDRVIPRFRARNTKTFQGKDPSKSLRRLAFLEKYCTELLRCEPRVTQSSDVVQFFLPQNQDLQPDFGKNSIVILPLEDIENKGRGVGDVTGKRLSMGNVTQPFVTETYRCVAPYETKDTKNRPFKAAVDEMLDVLIKDKAGWWLVENESKCLAWFPAPYLEKCDNEEEEDSDEDETSKEGMLYCAVRNYTSKKEDEISVNIGSVVEVLQKSDDGWWLIRFHGKAGYVPSMYLQPYTNPLLHFQKEMRSSTLNLAQLHTSEGSTMSNRTHALSRPQGSQVPCSLLPRGALLSRADKQKSRSLDVLSEPRPSPALPHVAEEGQAEPESRKSSLSGASEGSEFSFSDDSSSSGIDSLNASRLEGEEPQYSNGSPLAMVGQCSLAEGKLSPSSSDPNLSKIPSVPKVPPRPRDQEILSRCTTFTRKAALASKARLFPEHKQMQDR
ncbi:hypothetical protein MATL_G00008200 [Megalops atlanticus]|uniref:NADPH oxidase organizer 1 n=1 Tax=Megalops atlanticus TaxID=7932 RepID=A0A9D3THB6_MEGAT|nr:hypothetical protein MATL_G00008200 [Megalops atlanticus]